MFANWNDNYSNGVLINSNYQKLECNLTNYFFAVKPEEPTVFRSVHLRCKSQSHEENFHSGKTDGNYQVRH